MRAESIVAAFDELERRRREEYSALRAWLVRVTERQVPPMLATSLSDAQSGAHGGGDDRVLLDKASAAGLLGVSVRTLERRIRSGELRAVREGGSVKVRRADLDTYVDGLEVA